MSEPTTEQVEKALGSLEAGEQVTVLLKDGSEVTGTVSHDGENVQVSDSSEDTAVEIAAEQVSGISIRDTLDGPE